MRVFSVSYSAGSSSFCNVNNNGNTNNNSASGVGGVAPDSVSHTTCRAFSPIWPTQKEKTSCGLSIDPRELSP